MISLPKTNPPTGFLDSIDISDKCIVVVDDDISIHNLWAERFKSYKISKSEIIFFANPSIFKKWLLTSHDSNNFYLIDYEFLGNKENGLSLIQELGLESQSVLVTSHHADKEIQKRAEQNNVKVLSKALISTIPVIKNIVVEKNDTDLILIDNDALVRMTWEAKATSINKSLKTYSSTKDFLKAIDEIPVPYTVPIYIDSNLDGEKGEITAETIYKIGFNNIILQTGHTDININSFPWISAIVDKKFPDYIG
jgi:FixJ family two-component response regulator